MLIVHESSGNLLRSPVEDKNTPDIWQQHLVKLCKNETVRGILKYHKETSGARTKSATVARRGTISAII
jgi:hypothetical protein